MDLRKQLMLRHDKANMRLIRDYVGNDPGRFAGLMELFFLNEYRIQQRASWAVMHCADQHPELIGPYLKKMLENLRRPVHDAVKRNTMRVLRDITIPEELCGLAADVSFRYLEDPEEATAVRAFSMYVLGKIVRQEPELARELRLIIQEGLAAPGCAPAYRAAAGKVLRKLK